MMTAWMIGGDGIWIGMGCGACAFARACRSRPGKHENLYHLRVGRAISSPLRHRLTHFERYITKIHICQCPLRMRFR